MRAELSQDPERAERRTARGLLGEQVPALAEDRVRKRRWSGSGSGRWNCPAAPNCLGSFFQGMDSGKVREACPAPFPVPTKTPGRPADWQRRREENSWMSQRSSLTSEGWLDGDTSEKSLAGDS
ncbi:hypothetical protein H8959_003536 [Pygathrix nigripes]